MATSSFLKNVTLRGAKQCQAFIKALEKSKSCKENPVMYSKTVSDMDKEQIQKIFGGANNGNADRI